MFGDFIGRAGTTRINNRTLVKRNFSLFPWNAPANYPLTGKPENVYRGDLIEAVKEKAGQNGTILKDIDYAPLRQ